MEWISEWDYPDGKGMKQSAPFTQCLYTLTTTNGELAPASGAPQVLILTESDSSPSLWVYRLAFQIFTLLEGEGASPAFRKGSDFPRKGD